MKGCGVVGEVGKSGVIVMFDLWLVFIVNGFFHHFDSGGSSRQTFEHRHEVGVRHFSDGVSGRDHDGWWCSDVDR